MKKLKWSEISEPNDICCYTHTYADTPFGRFLLTWKSWKTYFDAGFDETPWGEIAYHGWSSVEEAQEWAEEEMHKKLMLALKELE